MLHQDFPALAARPVGGANRWVTPALAVAALLSAATRKKGVVAGFDRKVIAAAIATFPRNGMQTRAAPTI